MQRVLAGVLWVLMLLPAPGALAAVQASVDRTSISSQETVTLTLRTDEISLDTPPDLATLLADFQLVNGPNQSSRIQIINGQRSASIEWSWELLPKHTGELEIPAIDWAGGTTRPIRIRVQEPSPAQRRQQDELLFFETSVDHETVYVQQQILYTVRLYYAANLDQLQAQAWPQLNLDGALVRQLGDEKGYRTTVNNREFGVAERVYVIFPQQSGTLDLPPEEFIGMVGGRLFSRGKRIATRSDSLRIQVKPKPAAFPSANWLPVKTLRLSADWPDQQPQFVVGEPVSLQLRLDASGVTKSLLPTLDIGQPAQARIYADPPSLEEQASQDGITAIGTQVISIVPTAAGTLELPEIRIPWWSTETDSLQFAILPAQRFEVAPGAAQPQAPLPPAEQTFQAEPQPALPPAAPTTSLAWLTALVLGVAWLVTLGLLIRARRQAPAAEAAPAEPAVNSGKLLEQVRQACLGRDATAIRRAVLAWARQHWRNSGIRHIGDLRRLEPRIDAELRQLDLALYSPDHTGTWNPEALPRLLAGLQPEREPPAAAGELKPLYPTPLSR